MRVRRMAGWLVGGWLLAGGCAPTAQEWAEVDALPPGPARDNRVAALRERQATEDTWWDFAGLAGSLAGGFLPGAGLAVAALRRARRAQEERNEHAAAAKTLTGNLDQALVQLPTELRRQTIEKIKQVQIVAGQRETIRAYLRPAAELVAAATGEIAPAALGAPASRIGAGVVGAGREVQP